MTGPNDTGRGGREDIGRGRVLSEGWTVDNGQVLKDTGEGGREEKGRSGSCGRAGQWTVDTGQVPRGLKGDGREEKGRDGSRGRVGQVERFPKRPAEASFHKTECYSPCL